MRINIDFEKRVGKIKPMHGVGQPPACGLDNSAFSYLKEAGIPYSRLHDVGGMFGKNLFVDISNIFRDFGADETKEEAYDFKFTDWLIESLYKYDCKPVFRLGETIENYHYIKAYRIFPPKDAKKWARICEHIIMHYNEGWANGFKLGIEYWEIWNEADLNADDDIVKDTWGGTKKQFFEFYDVVAKYLKNRFPKLKIGGPASCGNMEWAEEFLAQLNAPLDFFSYHRYAYEPQFMAELTGTMKNMLRKYGYGDAETILNKWNYVRDWTDRKEYIQAIHGMKGAAYAAATMCAVQNAGNLDMLMYYDARQYTPWNGMFDFYTSEPLKGYYPFKMFSTLYKLGNQTECESDDRDIIATSAADNENCAVMITYYALDKAEDKTVKINTGLSSGMVCYLLDEENDMQEAGIINDGDTITMKPDSVLFLVG